MDAREILRVLVPGVAALTHCEGVEESACGSWPGKATDVDGILLEVRKAREAYAKEFGYDLQAIHRDLKAQEQASGRRIVSLPPRRPRPTMVNGTGSRASNVSGRTSG